MSSLNLETTHIEPEHYAVALSELRAGQAQLESMRRGEAQPGCFICQDTGHTAEQCWYHNPLLLAYMGWYALLGDFWRCFHCGAVFMEEATAREHFGPTPESVAECLRQLAALAEEEK